MSIRHLKNIHSCCNLGSISKTSEQLRVAQPAVNQTISDLKNTLESKFLFELIGNQYSQKKTKLFKKAKNLFTE